MNNLDAIEELSFAGLAYMESLHLGKLSSQSIYLDYDQTSVDDYTQGVVNHVGD